jgi:hypothetical protein
VGAEVTKTIRSIGHGLSAAGIVVVGMYFLAISLKGGAALHDALDPFTVRNYLALAPLTRLRSSIHGRRRTKVPASASCGTYKYRKGGKCLDARES